MLKMQKTDKTMTELEIDMNQRIGEWELIQESGVPLKPYLGLATRASGTWVTAATSTLWSRCFQHP